MADTKPAAGAPDGNSGTSDEGSKSKPDGNASTDGAKSPELESLKAKVDELVEDRNRWKSKARQLEQDKSDSDRDKANKSGDIEAIKASYDKEVKTLKDANEALNAKLHKEVALGALRKAASGKVVSVGQIERLIGDRIGIHEENGEIVAAVRNEKGDGFLYDAGKLLSVDKFLENFLALDENQNLALSTRKSGMGTSGPSQSGAGAADGGKIPSYAELMTMPDKGAAWMKANPDKLSKVSISGLKLVGS